jgi:hypothetical protein
MIPIVHRLSITSVRRSITAVQQPAAGAIQPSPLPTLTRSEIITVSRSELVAVPLSRVASVRRPGITAVRWLAIAAVLAVAVVLVATVPAHVAGLVMGSGLWNLPGRLSGAVAAGVKVSSDSLPLALGAIVVLAALSSSSGCHRHERW